MKIKAAILLLLGTWIGLVLGLSFLEAPLKFTAPGITTELALGIGQIMFTLLNKIEIVFSFLFLAFILSRNDLNNAYYFLSIFLILIISFQSIYLLPILTDRVDMILAGIKTPPSRHHIIFIILEISKFITLIILFFKTSKYLYYVK